MRYEIRGGEFPVVICELSDGEAMITERGSMVWQTPNMEMETRGGGLGKMFSRAFSGESLFQNISTARLWEIVAANTGIPQSMNPSKDDAIFVAQSRAIRELAHRGPCVIVGRLAGWVLRDRQQVLRVFVTAAPANAARRIASRLGLSPDEAARKAARVNTGRANHCRHYTGRPWADPSAYDLAICTDHIAASTAAEMIVQAAKAVAANGSDAAGGKC